MQEIKRIGIMSTAKIALLFGVLMGLVFGIIIALLTNYLPAEALGQLPTAYSSMSGISAIVAFPAFYGIAYFIGGIIGALIYNLFAGWVGGIKIELAEAKKKK